MQQELFIGLMSGTSLDGLDAALVGFENTASKTAVYATCEFDFPDRLRGRLLEAIQSANARAPEDIASLHTDLGKFYGHCVNQLIDQAKVDAAAVAAIGSHGQTVNHRPDASPPFSVQLGCGKAIAQTTGITTVNDFRRADIDAGGQGAPLAPAFHEWAFGQKLAIGAVVNIGGIANVTVLDPNKSLVGYDTGPGNTLLDIWARRHLACDYDINGEWAKSGTSHDGLLQLFLKDPYFAKSAPKSTGREYFHQVWLDTCLDSLGTEISAVDVQATLTNLTAISIANAVRDHDVRNVWICGGGAFNTFLLDCLATQLNEAQLATTAELGISPDWVEAIAFAWLARARIRNEAAGRPSVTGARNAAVLGVIHDVPKT